MCSIRNRIVAVAIDEINEGRTVLKTRDLLEKEYGKKVAKTKEFRTVANHKGLSIMHAIERKLSIALVPLTAVFFKMRKDGDEIIDEATAVLCVAGCGCGIGGSSIGFKIAENDVVTKTWQKNSNKILAGHIKEKCKRHSVVNEMLGVSLIDHPLASVKPALLKGPKSNGRGKGKVK